MVRGDDGRAARRARGGQLRRWALAFLPVYAGAILGPLLGAALVGRGLAGPALAAALLLAALTVQTRLPETPA
jgi:hypothetical protein